MKRTDLIKLTHLMSRLTSADIISIEKAQEFLEDAAKGGTKVEVFANSPFLPISIAEEIKTVIKGGKQRC